MSSEKDLIFEAFLSEKKAIVDLHRFYETYLHDRGDDVYERLMKTGFDPNASYDIECVCQSLPAIIRESYYEFVRSDKILDYGWYDDILTRSVIEQI